MHCKKSPDSFLPALMRRVEPTLIDSITREMLTGNRRNESACSASAGRMNHSNKDKRSSAENEKGRALIKANIPQPHTHPTQSGAGLSQGLAGVRILR
jgi:hypothetical protein